MAGNPYLEPIRQTLPRLLGSFDLDPTSASHGLGDRYRWAWGLIDFGNATFQGAAHGIARLWKHGLWPYPTDAGTMLRRIDAIFDGARRLTRRDGSLEEAFPHEGSFCVTALVAFDLLVAIDLLEADTDATTRARWAAVVAPMIGYLKRSDETHALISNHLATAVATLVRWHDRVGDPASDLRARMFLDRVVAHQSIDGWFSEYGGADPGYQSLCTGFLADVHARRPAWDLGERLARSIRFLWHFAHPDGSFGGIYGSRSTRFYFPGGIEALSGQVPEAAALADHLGAGIADHRVVGLQGIDAPNLIPMFNAYCEAAVLWGRRSASAPAVTVPALRRIAFRTHFADAGLWIDAGERHYTVVSTHKGGVVAHFRDGAPALLDSGVAVRDRAGAWGSTQAHEPRNTARIDDGTLIVEAPIRAMSKRLPTPAEFLLLRLLSVSVMRVPSWREAIKRALVRLLITRRDDWPGRNRRRIRLGPDLDIVEETTLPAGYARVADAGAFVSIHMASKGYWQVQDEAAGR